MLRMLRIGRNSRTAVSNEARTQLKEDIRQARREREVAQCLFENVIDSDRVDHAIYTLEAAEKRLDILLREAKLLWGDSEESSREGQRILL